MTKSLPLPPCFFDCPKLTQREKQRLVTKAKESAEALIDATRNNEGPVRWEEAGTHRGVQLYKGEARYPESVIGESIMYGSGAITLQSTLDEVAEFFDMSTDEKVASYVECNTNMLDGQLLYVLQDPSLLNEPTSSTRMHRSSSSSSKILKTNQVTVMWFVMDVPSKLMKHRDFLTVECQCTFMDVSGRRGWVRSFHSIKLSCCPDLSNYNLIRGSFYHTGYVFVESDKPGLLDVIFSAQVNMKSSVKIPAALYMTIQKKRLASIADLQKLITRRRLGAQHFLGDLECVLKSQRKRCNLCSAKFGLLVRKARCRKCGEVVCASACSTEWEVPIPSQGVRKIRVCSKCAQNTDPAVFEDIAPSEQSSDINGHENDMRMMNAYQYDSTSDTKSPRLLGQYSLDSNDYDDQGNYLQTSDRRGPSDNSYEEIRSQDDSFQNSDVEHPRPIGIEHADLDVDSYHYPNDSGEYDEAPLSQGRYDDRRYDPRNPDMYSYQTYGVTPPQYYDDTQKQALQRQQRALQKQQRLLQRQQQQQELLMRQCRQQNSGLDNCYVEMGTPLCSSELSESNYSSASSNAIPSFLTSSKLVRHTKHMGKPGPVTRLERDAAQRALQQRKHAKRRKAKDNPAHRMPPPSLSFDRPLTQLEQLQVQRWMEQEAKFREEVIVADVPFDLELESAEISPTNIRLHQSSGSNGLGKASDQQLPQFYRSLNSTTHSQDCGASTDGTLPLFDENKTRSTNLGQRTVSVADDEDGLDRSLAELAINFSSLLRPEDLRPTEESICLSLDSFDQDYGTESESSAADPGNVGASVAKSRPDASKMTIVKLYQRILELTKKQHELEAQPESDPDEKKEVACELKALYEKLHSEVEI